MRSGNSNKLSISTGIFLVLACCAVFSSVAGVGIRDWREGVQIGGRGGVPSPLTRASLGSRTNSSTGSLGALRDSERTWAEFNSDEDSELNIREFTELCRKLFQDGKGRPYQLKSGLVRRIFRTFDSDSNGRISNSEFGFCFRNWISKITNPVSVLIVVDVQNDFIDGSIALRDAPAGQEGKEVVSVINRMVETIPFRQVFYTKDWHPADHLSFFDNLHLWRLHETSPIQDKRQVRLHDTVVFERLNGEPAEQMLWPRHCVHDTWGAALDNDLNVINGSIEVRKGLQSDMDSYSAFMENDKQTFTPLKGYIDAIGATDVYVVGLAYDVCVGATTTDSLILGYRTVLVEDATRGIMPERIAMTRRKILELNGAIVQSSEVPAMIEGRDRRPELGLYLLNRLQGGSQRWS